MRRSIPHAITVLLGVVAAGLPASRAAEKGDLAPPFAVKAGGVFIDVPRDRDGRTEHDNAYPWFGDLDGRPDIVVNEQEELLPTGRDEPRWVVWKNLGGGKFAERILLDTKLGGHELQVGDVDGDGDLDIVSKPWSASPGNGAGGRFHVDFLENRLKVKR